ncbi:hypothetical protein [Maricaulis sp.]|uniref:hypothetical protein n=1 Tax=Maricaulis sp. TaxID=1486257 RepID=UPI0025B8D597|nr:hypothetical protein [Maricaulis sp.]
MDSADPTAQAERRFEALIGAFLMVAFSDGEFSKSEEYLVRVRLLREQKPRAMTDVEADAIYAKLETEFRSRPDATAERVLALVAEQRGNGVARRAITEAARKALMADRISRTQEDYALNRLAAALGLRDGEI